MLLATAGGALVAEKATFVRFDLESGKISDFEDGSAGSNGCRFRSCGGYQNRNAIRQPVAKPKCNLYKALRLGGLNDCHLTAIGIKNEAIETFAAATTAIGANLKPESHGIPETIQTGGSHFHGATGIALRKTAAVEDQADHEKNADDPHEDAHKLAEIS